MTLTTEAHELEPFGAAGGEFDPAAAFFESLEGPEKKTAQEPAEAPVEAPKGDDTGEPTKAAPEPSTAVSDDDVEVELPFGAETKSYKLKDVRAALEAQAKGAGDLSAQVAAGVAAQTERATAALNKAVSAAAARYEPYANVDWLTLSRDPSIPLEDFQAMRAEAMAAHGDLSALTTELDSITGAGREARGKALREAQQACVGALMDPEKGIKGFNRDLYEGLMSFATEAGLQGARDIVDPAAIKLLHDAMQFRKGQATAAVQVQKVVAQPKRVIKPGAGGGDSGTSITRSAAIKAMAGGGSDAVARAFEADLAR